MGYKMATRKTRVNLSVDDELNGLLDDVARLTNKPKATFIVDVLDDLKPMLRELTEALALAEEKKNVIPNLAKLSAEANAMTAVINGEMAEFYSRQMDLIEADND